MRIAIINRHVSRSLGGSETQCNMIANELILRGHDVLYLAIEGAEAEADCAYTLVETPEDQIGTALKVHRPDVIYWRYNKRLFLKTAQQARRLRIPFVFACSSAGDLAPLASTIPADAQLKFARLKRGYQQAQSLKNYMGFLLADLIITQTYEQKAASPHENTLVVRNSYLDLQGDFEWPRPYVCWVGTVKPLKRPEVFIELASRMKESDLDFLIIGSDPFGYDFSQAPSNLHYIGTLPYPQANSAIRDSFAVIHTSRTEGFSNVLIQGWSQGVPALTLGLDPDNLITTHELGYVAQDIDELELRLRQLIDDKDLFAKVSQNASEFSNETFDLKRNAALLEEVLGQASKAYTRD